jgi:uncharacterized membrane protein
MSDADSAGSDTHPPSSHNPPDPHNPFGDVRNVLGFLLAGFGAILTFLGVRSSEVTTVLRNDSPQASVIALILLLGVLAAVWAVATDSNQKISRPSVVAIGAVLVGVGALVAFAIPIEASPFTISGNVSLVIGSALVLAGLAVLARRRLWEIRKVCGGQVAVSQMDAKHNCADGGHDLESASKPSMRLVDVLILSSVVLIAIAAYGAMRLETKSQLSFSAQVGAIFSLNGPLATVSVDIAATKIAQSDWVFVDVYAVPAETDLTVTCKLLYKRFGSTIPSNSAPCTTDPCLYFSQSKYWSIAKCAVLSNGSINPNAAGDVDETLDVPFLAAQYQYVDVRAEVCSIKVCEGSSSGQNSRLDWAVPASANKPG